MKFDFSPIGYVRSCFKEKFGIPRQSGLVEAARATVELTAVSGSDNSLRGLEGFSHVWLIYVFHQSIGEGWRPLVRPPRLGGNRKVGVFASRSPHRPNPIGISVVRLERIEASSNGAGPRLHVGGVDLLDGTPVLDVKPYLPYADSRPNATSGWAEQVDRPRLQVEFSTEALEYCERSEHAELRALIEQMVGEDPRPAFQVASKLRQRQGTSRVRYASRILDYDVHWIIEGEGCLVTQVVNNVH